jgi:outer membrane lipoprotein-sorting protein
LNLRNLVLAVILGLLLLAGCRALPPAAPPPTVASPEELLSRLQSRQRQIRSFQGKGRITFLSPQQNYSGTAILKGILPATLRVDVLDFFGRTILSFYTNGDEVQVLSPREGKIFQGRATPRNLAAFIPPAVSLPQALRLLVGALPLSDGPSPRLTPEPGSERYLLEWSDPSGAPGERLWVSARGFYPLEEAWYGGAAAPRFTASLADFGALVPDLPGKLTLKTPAPQIELRLAYTELTLNPALNPGDLVLKPPPGVAVVQLP